MDRPAEEKCPIQALIDWLNEKKARLDADSRVINASLLEIRELREEREAELKRLIKEMGLGLD